MTETAIADIGGFVPSDVVQYEMLAPGSRAPTGWVISLAGPYHDKAVRYAQDANRARLARSAAIEARVLNGGKVKPDERGVDELRAENMAFLRSRVLGWSPVKIGFISAEPIAFSEDRVAEVFGHVRMGWAYAQLLEVLNDEASFTPRSATK